MFAPCFCPGKEVLSSSPLGLGYIKHIENKHRRIQHSLSYPPNSILCPCLFLLYLWFSLPNISNSHAPTLESTNPSRLDPERCYPNMGPDRVPTEILKFLNVEKLGRTTTVTKYDK